MTDEQRAELLEEHASVLTQWNAGRTAIDQQFQSLALAYAETARHGARANEIAGLLHDNTRLDHSLHADGWKRCLVEYLDYAGRARKLWEAAGCPTHESGGV